MDGGKKRKNKFNLKRSLRHATKVDLITKPKNEESKQKATEFGVASNEGVTSFEPDTLFSQDTAVTPAKWTRKAMHSSIKHKVTKTLRKVPQSSQERQTPSPATALIFVNDATSPNQSSGNDVKRGCDAEGVVKNPLTPNKDKSEGVAPPLDQKTLFSRVSRADLETKIEDLSAQVNKWKSHYDNLQSQLDTLTPQGVGAGEKEAMIKHLEQQLTLVQMENGQLQNDVNELEEKLDNVKTERDNLSKQNLKLFAAKNTYIEMLSEMENIKSEVAVTGETLTSLANQTAAKVTEVSDHKEEKEVLQKELDDLRGELVARRLQADYYEEDLKKESQDRENMAGRIDDEKAQQKLKLQMFVENSESTNEQLDRVREINTTLEVEKANLEADLTEQEKKISELEKSIRGYTKQLTCHEQLYLELNKLEEERQSKEQLEKELVKCLEQTDLATVEKMSLQNQLNVVEINYKLKVKQFEIMAAEKNNMEDQIGRMNARYSTSQLELTDCRKQLETTIADISRLSDERRKLDDEVGKTTARYNALQLDFTDCREQLETNNSRLSDEILAKTQQVRHYKKQTDSYKATLDETADGLENTERELQKKVKDLETIKIRADQIQQRLDHELKKTLAQVPAYKRRML